MSVVSGLTTWPDKLKKWAEGGTGSLPASPCWTWDIGHTHSLLHAWC